jgi:hypothetical protein
MVSSSKDRCIGIYRLKGFLKDVTGRGLVPCRDFPDKIENLAQQTPGRPGMEKFLN